MSKVTALISDDRPVIHIYGEDTGDHHVEIGFETQSDANVAVQRLIQEGDWVSLQVGNAGGRRRYRGR